MAEILSFSRQAPSVPWKVSHPTLGQRFWQRIRETLIPSSHRPRIHAARKRLRALAQLALHDDPTSRRTLYYQLRSMDPLEFEELVLEALFRLGNPIRRNPRYSGDGGLDGQVFLSGKWAFIQCKRYRDAITPQHVADFSALLERRHVPLGLFVHTGRTGETSRSHAARAGAQIVFVSGERLCQLLAATASAQGWTKRQLPSDDQKIPNARK